MEKNQGEQRPYRNVRAVNEKIKAEIIEGILKYLKVLAIDELSEMRFSIVEKNWIHMNQ